MPVAWPRINYSDWSQTCDTLHAHTQVLGKLAVALAPPEPQLQHAALRLTARGWETAPLPAPDGSGALVGALDLRTHEARRRAQRRGTAARPASAEPAVADVTARRGRARSRGFGGAVAIDPRPQEVRVDGRVGRGPRARELRARARVGLLRRGDPGALVLAAFRAPYRGRSTPVNAWWGSFDLAVSLFSGVPAEPPSDDFIMRNAMDVAGGRGRLVARRPTLPEGRVLRVRLSER